MTRDDEDYDSNELENTGEESDGVRGGRFLGNGFGHVPKSVSARGGRREGWGQEGIEMVDRTRPW
jgi:hypothetical protein